MNAKRYLAICDIVNRSATRRLTPGEMVAIKTLAALLTLEASKLKCGKFGQPCKDATK